MIISVTERGTFKRCRKRWDYSSRSRQGLTSLAPPYALSFGTLVHEIHETWLEHPEAEPESVVAIAAVETAKTIAQTYIERVGVAPDSRELASFEEQVSLALDMFTNYKERWGASLPEGYTLMHAEQTLVLPIPGDYPCARANCGAYPYAYIHEIGGPPGHDWEPHQLEATLDALMADSSGRLWILERKTYNSKPRIDALQMNDQFIAYLWALRQLNMGPVGGILYDGMWKRYKERRNLEDLFFRVPLIRSPEEIDNFEVQLRDEVLDMANDPRIYRNARWEGCWDCQFTGPCMAEFRGEDVEYAMQRFTKRKRTDDLWSQNLNNSGDFA